MSKLLSFVAGAAEGFSEMIDKSEKSAKEEAALRVRRLMENHKEVMESNLKLENELKAEEGWIKTYFSNATPEQVAYLQSNPAALQALKKMPDPTKVGELGNVIKIAAANEAASVTQDQLTALPAVANEVAARVKEKARSTGFFRNLADEAGERVGITTERSLARGLGTTIEQMESIKRTARPSIEGAFDVAKTLPPKSFTERENEVKVKALDAQQSGDPAAIAAAEADVDNITKTKAMFTPEQLDYNKVLSKAKAVLIEPDKYSPEQIKKAQAIFDKNNQLMSREKSAKGDGEKEAKIPAIGALNSHVSGSVQEALKAQFGQQVKDGKITMTPNPQTGEVAINILGMDAQERVNVEKAKFDAASRALSMYVDPRPGAPVPRDVAAALDRYKYSLEQAQKGVTAPPSPDGTATPPAKAAAIPTANSVTVGNKVYNRPANFTDDQWNAYKKSVGATK